MRVWRDATCCWVGRSDGQSPVPFRHGKAQRALPHFLTQLPCPLPWLIGRHSFIASWSKEVRKGKKGKEERVKCVLDLTATLPTVTLLVTPGSLRTPVSTICRQEHSRSEPAFMGVASSSEVWELWFSFKNQIASIFCPKGIHYNL